MGLLETINSPCDLKRLTPKELNQLAKEIRRVIVDVVSKNGGHLAPNLGVVELTLALHYVFNSPEDKIIWDVGHQCYTHKIITGRRDLIHTIRKHGGLAGFPKRSESPHDIVDTGHSSTSISIALGMACAMSLKAERRKIIAVIGDGAMTAGLAFEGLNNAGHIKKDLIVVLNDNEMSISPNVGALSSFLSRKLTGQFATSIKKELESLLKRFYGGEQIWHLIKKSEESLKAFLTPGMLFEAFQFNYIGPLPGHHIESLIETFSNVKHLEGPVLIHVITKKGKGYLPAEEKPEKFHSTSPFNIETGEQIIDPDAPPTYTKVFSETVIKLAKTNPRIVAITAAMPTGTGLDAFSREFPNRFFDVGIAEQHAVTFAAGLALEGLLPVVAIYSTFLQRAFDQILHDVCLNNLHVIFAIDRGGLVGDDGQTHHGVFDLSYLRLIPNMIIMVPRDENELQHMLYTATTVNSPVAIRYPRGNSVGVCRENTFKRLEIGKGEVLKDGKDVIVLCVGPLCYDALKVADILEKEGISVGVIDAKFVKPLDSTLICDYAKKTRAIITLEENVLIGGFGSAVLELLENERLTNIKVKRLGIPDRFIQHGDVKYLKKECKIDEEALSKAIREVIS